jgi:hypothetical protein
MRLPDKIAKQAISFFNRRFKPESIFCIVLVCFIPFLFLKSLIAIWSCVTVFMILTLCRRGKIKLLPSFLVTLGVTFFALLSPFGKILYQIGAFRITSGALESGLHRSGILVGMVFLSQLAVSSDLNFPGSIGRFLANTFRIFDQLNEKPISFKPGNIIVSIDKRLIEIWTQILQTELPDKKANKK